MACQPGDPQLRCGEAIPPAAPLPPVPGTRGAQLVTDPGDERAGAAARCQVEAWLGVPGPPRADQSAAASGRARPGTWPAPARRVSRPASRCNRPPRRRDQDGADTGRPAPAWENGSAASGPRARQPRCPHRASASPARPSASASPDSIGRPNCSSGAAACAAVARRSSSLRATSTLRPSARSTATALIASTRAGLDHAA